MSYLFIAVLIYVAIAYVLMPFLWERYVKRHPALQDLPGRTMTRSDIPGDPINIALVGSEEDVIKAMVAAGWFPADPLTLRSSLKIAAATVLRRPYDEAPVSNLYFWGRKEDLAFEKPVGDDPRKRHHVRFWASARKDDAGRALWAGSATYDRRVGFSHTTGQVTHKIEADIDAERDLILADLQNAGFVLEFRHLDGFHEQREGRNGGGDPWHTDGRLLVIGLASSPSNAENTE